MGLAEKQNKKKKKRATATAAAIHPNSVHGCIVYRSRSILAETGTRQQGPDHHQHVTAPFQSRRSHLSINREVKGRCGLCVA